jgi:alanine racemase
MSSMQQASLPQSTCRRVQLDIDLDILCANFRAIAAAVSPCDVMAVLKANAYGLGVRPIAEALATAGAARFGVAELNGALELIDLGLPVHILGGVLPDEIPDAVAQGVILAITDRETAEAVNAEAGRQGRRARCHFLVDTGMGRLGILADEAEDTIVACAGLSHLDCEGIYTHCPVAYQAGGAFTRNQIARFRGLLDRLAARGITFAWRHMANSDAINNFPGTRAPPFNLVRPGINLYGCFDIEGGRMIDVRSVLTLRTRLAAVRRLRAGSTVGYGCTYTLPREMTVGTIPAGYADGLPLALSNRGHVLIRGAVCQVLGRVSMDYTTVDLTQVPEAKRGDEVLCIGGDGPQRISVETWAQLKGTHPYDIICSIGGRVERRYLPARAAGGVNAAATAAAAGD